jgi:hypothetical protein
VWEGRTFQLLPSQIAIAPLDLVTPTAMQKEALEQSALIGARIRGGGMRRQRAPVSDSASAGAGRCDPVWPTARQRLVPVHDTADSAAAWDLWAVPAAGCETAALAGADARPSPAARETTTTTRWRTMGRTIAYHFTYG